LCHLAISERRFVQARTTAKAWRPRFSTLQEFTNYNMLGTIADMTPEKIEVYLSGPDLGP
jgi:hypothetical protein